jgi:hypothetical protein
MDKATYTECRRFFEENFGRPVYFRLMNDDHNYFNMGYPVVPTKCMDIMNKIVSDNNLDCKMINEDVGEYSPGYGYYLEEKTTGAIISKKKMVFILNLQKNYVFKTCDDVSYIQIKN